ncbi:MAG: SPOR domain-containing protein [Pseudomonadales bacterium]
MSHDFARSQRIRKEAPRAPKRKKSKGIPSWLWVLVGTLVGCLIMFLVYLSGVRPPQSLPAAANTNAPAATPAAPEQPPAPPKRVSPVFEFYTKLPEGGQPVTDIAPAAQPTMPQQPVAPAGDAAGQPAPTPAVTTTAAQSPIAAEPEKKTTVATPAPAEELDPMQQLLAQKEQERKAKGQAKVIKEKPSATATSAGGARYLQAGVFRNKAEAEKLRSKISRLGVSASIRTVSGADGASLQKVMAGPFRSSEEMDDAKIILNGNGINSISAK